MRLDQLRENQMLGCLAPPELMMHEVSINLSVYGRGYRNYCCDVDGHEKSQRAERVMGAEAEVSCQQSDCEN